MSQMKKLSHLWHISNYNVKGHMSVEAHKMLFATFSDAEMAHWVLWEISVTFI